MGANTTIPCNWIWMPYAVNDTIMLIVEDISQSVSVSLEGGLRQRNLATQSALCQWSDKDYQTSQSRVYSPPSHGSRFSRNAQTAKFA